MPGPRLVAVVGKKNAGKTTLVVALVHEMIRRGHRVMTDPAKNAAEAMNDPVRRKIIEVLAAKLRTAVAA